MSATEEYHLLQANKQQAPHANNSGAERSTLLEMMQQSKSRVEDSLEQLFANRPRVAPRLVDAMAYASLSGGKRIRPALVYVACQVFNGELASADTAATAVELLHAYSLVHDDLPAMDDDALRRGRPTCHIAYDEATAILAGDALQSLAFEMLVQSPSSLSAHQILAMVRILVQAGGGMAVGQVLDLSATDSANVHEQYDQQTLESMVEQVHRYKTGYLIRASLELGAVSAGLSEDSAAMQYLRQYGDAIGLAFQIQDDILDAVSTTQVLGKVVGADVSLNKLTYPAVMGIKAAQQEVTKWCQLGCHYLKDLPSQYDAQLLLDMADYLVMRQY